MKQNKIPRNEYIIKPKGKTNPYKHDVVYSNLGQWKYPGQVTKIPSNQITMQGVNYPVQGIDDTGYSQMMYPGMDYTFPGEYVTEYPMAQKGRQVEDNDSWLENVGEIIDPTGISSWDDVYRAYKNTGLSKETALEAFGAIPLLGKISKVTEPGIHLIKYSGIDKILRNTLPRNKSLSRAANVASKTGRGTDAVQALLGAKDNSGFTWDLRHGEVPKYGGRNIFPQADLGEHGDFAYGGSSDMYPFGGIHTKTDTHMATGGWLDTMQVGGQKPWGEMTAQERTAYLDAKEANAKAETASRKQATKEHYQDYVKDSMKKTLEHPMFNTAQYFTPEGMAIGAIKGLANVGPDVAKGDYSAAAFDALTALPAVTPAVKNTYKINPWAEKLKNPNSSYRVAGLDAAEDFKKTGILRSQTPDVPKGATLQERAMSRPTAFPSFQKGYADLNYLPDEGGVIFKTDLPTFKRGELNPVTGFPIKGRHYAHRVIDPKTGATVTNVPGADVKMYNSDPHWLKGYPEVPVELPGSPNGFFEETKALGKGIVSELKQIPKNLKYKINNYSELKKLPAQYKNAVKEMTTPEGLTRLKNLGIDDTDDFLKYLNDIKKAGSNELGNSFYPVGQGAININPEELKLYRSTKAPFAVPETVIDHELGHAIQYYLKKKGKVYPSLKNPYNAPTDIDMEAVDKLLPHTTNKVSTFFKEQALQKSPEELANMFKGNKHDLRSAEYFFNSESGREPLAHLRELKRNLKNEGVINDIQETVTPEHLKAFIDKTGNKDRVMSFMQNTPEAHKTLSTLLNKIPAVVPIGLGAAALQQEKLGGWLDNEFKRGGQKGLKKYTSKNIQSSVNDIMLRNETLFGPAGKRRFKPGLKYKDGGWLDNLLD